MTAPRLKELGIIDTIISEPLGGALRLSVSCTTIKTTVTH